MVTPSPAPYEAAVLIVQAKSGEVLVTERRIDLMFLGGFAAFPGGRVEPDDGKGQQRFVQAAIRETHEETGLDLSRYADRLRPAGHWVTPPAAPVRYDTWFYYVEIDEVPTPSPPEDGEHSWVRFGMPGHFLAEYRALRLVFSPPLKIALEVLAERVKDPAGVLSRVPGANTEENLDFEPISGIRQLPLRTPTLPPATHTNCYLVGEERLLFVDPATYDPDERDKLLGYAESLIERGSRPEAVFLTHHHPDHIGAAEWLAEQLNVPIWAHPETKALLERKVKVDRAIVDGQRIDLGKDQSGRSFVLEALHTPGHDPGHLVLADARPGGTAMIVGDMVAAIGTIIIDPPEGDMAVYLAQLERLRARPQGVLLPAHGPPIVGGHQKLDQYLAHRRAREAKVLAALERRVSASPFDLLEDAYDDTPAALHPLAARSCLAHLLKLVTDGRAIQRGEWFEARRGS